MANNIEKDLREILVSLARIEVSHSRVEEVLFHEIKPQVESTSGRILVLEKNEFMRQAEKKGRAAAEASIPKTKTKNGIMIFDYQIGGKEFMFLAVLISQVLLLITGK